MVSEVFANVIFPQYSRISQRLLSGRAPISRQLIWLSKQVFANPKIHEQLISGNPINTLIRNKCSQRVIRSTAYDRDSAKMSLLTGHLIDLFWKAICIGLINYSSKLAPNIVPLPIISRSKIISFIFQKATGPFIGTFLEKKSASIIKAVNLLPVILKMASLLLEKMSANNPLNKGYKQGYYFAEEWANRAEIIWWIRLSLLSLTATGGNLVFLTKLGVSAGFFYQAVLSARVMSKISLQDLVNIQEKIQKFQITQLNEDTKISVYDIVKNLEQQYKTNNISSAELAIFNEQLSNKLFLELNKAIPQHLKKLGLFEAKAWLKLLKETLWCPDSVIYKQIANVNKNQLDNINFQIELYENLVSVLATKEDYKLFNFHLILKNQNIFPEVVYPNLYDPIEFGINPDVSTPDYLVEAFPQFAEFAEKSRKENPKRGREELYNKFLSQTPLPYAPLLSYLNNKFEEAPSISSSSQSVYQEKKQKVSKSKIVTLSSVSESAQFDHSGIHSLMQAQMFKRLTKPLAHLERKLLGACHPLSQAKVGDLLKVSHFIIREMPEKSHWKSHEGYLLGSE